MLKVPSAGAVLAELSASDHVVEEFEVLSHMLSAFLGFCFEAGDLAIQIPRCFFEVPGAGFLCARRVRCI
jgi:hypothetical protein